MPLMDGWQVADALRADRRTRDVPRIMISGLPIDHLMRACADPRRPHGWIDDDLELISFPDRASQRLVERAISAY